MAWRNGPQHWGMVARTFHWGMALLILIEVPAGFVMSRTFGATAGAAGRWHYWSANFHHTAGLLILALAIARAGWRLAGPVPAFEPGLPAPTRAAARGAHWLLYALLLLIPLSGWAALSALADSPLYGRTILWFFGTNGFDWIVPRIVEPVQWDSHALLRYSLFARTHRWLLIAGAVLLALHILAALRHHFIKRDATLRRMLGG